MEETPKRHVLRELDVTGDTQHHWTPGDKASTALVADRFVELLGMGHTAFRMEGNQGTIIRKFDPEAETIIVTPPLIGG